MFNTHETLNDLINEMYTYFESKRGREKRKKYINNLNNLKKVEQNKTENRVNMVSKSL